MSTGRTLGDKDIRRLIFCYLKSGVMADGSFTATEEGTPQGGPLSPLLSNISLTPYDKELEKRRLRFVRYADDGNIFVKSGYASRRVKESVTRFLEGRMKLKVNREKTEARKAEGSSFLGFTFVTCGKDGKLGMCKPRAKKFEQRIREITKRNRGVSTQTLIKELNAYLRGWINYYAREFFKKYLADKITPWIHRRIRQYLWKQWKKAGRRKEMLKKVCNPNCRWKLKQFTAYTSNRYWKLCGGVLNGLIPRSSIIDGYGLLNIDAYYERAHAGRMMTDKIVRSGHQLMLGFEVD